ncbi:MAG: hypothetical protein HY767_04000, partial [Candidatus Omnitrophica bacterium]|nr:hypothetical protein [Candidatus Omnitrophota bacterium]
KKTKRARQALAFAALGMWVLGLAGIAVAGEAVKFKESESSFYSDLFDQNIYSEGMNQLDLGRWGRKLFGKELPSKNVNVFDEVPDSGFFTNRHGRERLSPEALEKGYQETSGPDLSKPLQVTAAEQRGIYPRFWARDARGDEYLLEFDPQGNMDLVTGAEVVASRFYYALGYTVPQFTVLSINADQFQVAPDATTWEDTGFKKALSQKRFEEYLMVLPQNGGGLYRASACKIMKGDYHGIFSFESRRKDDPADLVNHRDRREIRTLGIFASWLNHYDLRESDTLDISAEENGQTVMKHYLADFNGALGSTQEGPKEPMLGYEYMIDYGETSKTILALGFREKPWQKKWRRAGETIPGSSAVGYFTNDLFDPSKYKTQFPYEAFRVTTRADGFWAAKLLMTFSDEDIRTMIKAGHYSDATDAETLAKTLAERRDMIARFWLSRANPLDGFSFSGGKLTFKDLAVEHGFASKEGAVYSLEVLQDGRKEKIAQSETGDLSFDIAPEWVPANGEAKIVLRVRRAPAEKLSPAVTILLNAAGIQGIRHED